MLSGINVALGVTGSIAAVKTVELAHELRRRGAEVRAVTTPSAESIIHPWSLEYATTNPVVTEITGAIEHVELCGDDGWADVLLIAPATANTIGKIAVAIDDTPVTTCATTALGSNLPVVIAPAMHEPMYDHPGVLEAIDRVRSWGVSFVNPRLAEGKAKIASEASIALEVSRTTGSTPLEGRHVVVTSGKTIEDIDPVRVITSRATGKMGRAVARACYALGATVTLVHDGSDVSYASVRSVESAEEMRSETLDAVTDADALVAAAAVSDFTVDTATEKIRSGQEITFTLNPVPKLVDAVREAHPDIELVCFKLETTRNDDDLVASARSLLSRVDASFVVANSDDAMGANDLRALVVRDDGIDEHTGSKSDLAAHIATELASILGERK